VSISSVAAWFFYNVALKNWDVIVIGGGIIGLSLSIELRKTGARVLVVERGEPGHEASYAAGGMLVDCLFETSAALQPLATASARMYPEFVHELQVESGMNVDLRDQGTILFSSISHPAQQADALPAPLAELEPALADLNRPAFYLKERSVDPRLLTAAALHAAKRRGVDISSGDEVAAVNLSDGRASGLLPRKHHSTRRRSSTARGRGRARSRRMLFQPARSKDKCCAWLRPREVC
jgi:glycine oxidase